MMDGDTDNGGVLADVSLAVDQPTWRGVEILATALSVDGDTAHGGHSCGNGGVDSDEDGDGGGASSDNHDGNETHAIGRFDNDDDNRDDSGHGNGYVGSAKGNGEGNGGSADGNGGDNDGNGGSADGSGGDNDGNGDSPNYNGDGNVVSANGGDSLGVSSMDVTGQSENRQIGDNVGNSKGDDGCNSGDNEGESREASCVHIGMRKIAQVERDYRQGFDCQFRTDVPPNLMGKIPGADFKAAIESINAITIAADRVDMASIRENVLACVSCYTSLWCVRTKWQKAITDLDVVIEDINRRLFIPNGFLLVHPKQNGFRLMDVVATH